MVAFFMPFLISNRLYEQYIIPTRELEQLGQTTEKRLNELISVLCQFVSQKTPQSSQDFSVVLKTGERESELIKLRYCLIDCDNRDLVIKIMLADE
ncbi:hypothetical protein AGMMS50212_10410 [Spirochaetia bacterium]|nr:hypothetical protein AGMMS50212_10410 [Spirochaetia bacterium]